MKSFKYTINGNVYKVHINSVVDDIAVPTGRKSQPNIRASDVYWNFPFPVREEDGAVLHE